MPEGNSGEGTGKAPEARIPRRHTAVLAGIAVIVVACGLGLAIFAGRESAAKREPKQEADAPFTAASDEEADEL